MHTPVIAIAPGRTLFDYEESLRRAGAALRIVDRAADRPADLVRQADGILLTGGRDVLPSLYGASPHGTFSAAEAGRDEYEIELASLAVDADLPLLAICRGAQVLNVARGGTLVQDIPEEIGHVVEHMTLEPSVAIAHEVAATPGGLLERLMREHIDPSTRFKVNSRHHQAPNAPGEGLVATATAPDGVIEAVEDPSRRFCLGVQWHPENFWQTGEFRSLFEGFVRACRK